MTKQTRAAIAVAAGIAMLMGLEVVAQAAAHRAAQVEPPSWRTFIAQVDQALATRDVSVAERAAHDAYTTALTGREWDGLVAAGDAYVRVGDTSRTPDVGRAKARQAYLAAFFRARSEKSLEGVARSAQAFADLGDREVAAQCLKTAEALVASRGDAGERAIVNGLAERLAGRVAGLESGRAF
jgi:hypothetical protein